MLLECFCKIAVGDLSRSFVYGNIAFRFIKLPVYFRFGLHYLKRCICYTLYCTCFINAPFAVIPVIPVFVLEAEQQPITEIVKHSLGVSRVVHGVLLNLFAVLVVYTGFAVLSYGDDVVIRTGTLVAVDLGAVLNSFLYSQCSVGRSGLLSVPLRAHKPRCAENAVNSFGIPVKPEGKYIT